MASRTTGTKKLIGAIATFLLYLTVVNITVFASEALKITHNVNFRSGPSTDSEIMIVIEKGSDVEFVSEENGWTKVDYAGTTGYINNEYLQSKAEYEQNIKNNVKLTPWSEAKKIVEIGRDIKVYDVYSGLTYVIRSFSNGKHADVEPVTKDDTRIMKETYGGVWKWNPRPVWVTINGVTMAASINGMPHGGGVNGTNGMDGQICLHFQGSSTHNGNKSFARWHQDEVQNAYNLA